MGDDTTGSEWQPKTCRMPDLSGLRPISPWFVVLRVLAGHGPTDGLAYTLWVNFIRLVDKAVSDYGHAREALLVFLANSGNRADMSAGIGYLLLVTGHLETCVGTMVRAIDVGRSLKRAKSGKPSPVPEKPAIFRDQVYKPINDARNGIEHLYEDLIKRPNKAGFAMPAATENGFDVNGIVLRYEDLAQWLSELHALAARVGGAAH